MLARVSIVASSLVIASALLSGCGVDTTGISPASSSEPKGPITALVTVTEYGDLQCPACKAAHELLTTPLLASYQGKIRFEYKHFPLRSIHPYAFRAAQAAECAADQGAFWEFVDYAYAHQDELKSSPYADWATVLKLNGDLFGRCLSSGIKGDAVLKDYADGEALNVRGTPTYFVNGQRVDSTLEALSKAIDDGLAQAKKMPL